MPIDEKSTILSHASSGHWLCSVGQVRKEAAKIVSGGSLLAYNFNNEKQMKSIQTSLSHYILEPALKKFGELGAVYLIYKLIDLVYPQEHIIQLTPVQTAKMFEECAFQFLKIQLEKPESELGYVLGCRNFMDENERIDASLEKTTLVGNNSTEVD